MEQPSDTHRTDARAVRAFLGSDLGRSTLRRYLVDCAQVVAGQEALLLHERGSEDGTSEAVAAMAQMLRDLGVHVVTLAVDSLMARQSGAMEGSYAFSERHQIPKPVFAAMQAADLTFDFTPDTGGSVKYNLDFYTLGTYHARGLHGARQYYQAAANPERLRFPSEVLRILGARVSESLISAAEARAEFHLTSPWGTDLRFTSLPGDISLAGGDLQAFHSRGRFRSPEPSRLFRILVGFSVTQSCEGVWVTKHVRRLGGLLSGPLRVTLKDSFVAGAEGGPEAQELLKILEEDNSGVHAILTGVHPKVAPFRDGHYVLNNEGIEMGVTHCSLGGPGLFYRNGEWGPVGDKHVPLGNIPRISLWAGSECVFDNGRPAALTDPDVRAAVSEYGDPDDLLEPFDWDQAPV